jgi:hypothetical protein
MKKESKYGRTALGRFSASDEHYPPAFEKDDDVLDLLTSQPTLKGQQGNASDALTGGGAKSSPVPNTSARLRADPMAVSEAAPAIKVS